MANLTTAQDIIEYILYRGGQNTGSADPYYTTAVEHANSARMNLVKGINPMNPKTRINFKWATRYPYDNFIIQPRETTASAVAVTNNSASVTFGASITADMVGWHLMIDDEKDVYRIKTHGGSTDAATLDSVYTGTTDAAASFKLVKLEYDLGSNDIIRIISPFTIFRTNNNDNPEYKIYGVHEDEFDRQYPLATLGKGTPDFFKVVYVSDGDWKILLNKYSEENLIKVEYKIIALPSDITAGSANADILVPREYREVIGDWATALLLLDKSDDKAEYYLKKASAGFESMVYDYKIDGKDISPNFGRFISREDSYGDKYNSWNRGGRY